MKCSLILIPTLFIFNHFVKAQGFRGIVPLRSTCNDVKRILNVEKCEYPESRYKFSDGEIIVNFVKKKPAKYDKLCWKISPNKVKSIYFFPSHYIPLSAFAPRLDFIKLYSSNDPEANDIPEAKIYGIKEKGIEAFVAFDAISRILYEPTPTEFQKFSYPCSSPDAGDWSEYPHVRAFQTYWKLPIKEETEKFKDLLPIFLEEIQNKSSLTIYVVYYYKKRKDIKLGLEQAERAKKYFETGGIKSENIKIYNGGKENNPRRVIHFGIKIESDLSK